MRFLRQTMVIAFSLAVLAAIPAQAFAQQATARGPGQAGGLGQTGGPGQAGAPPGARGLQQGPGPGGRAGMPGPGNDAMGRFFFSPRQVLDAAELIALQPEQRQAVEALMEEAETRFREQRYQLGNEMTRIGSLAVDQPIDETAILAQLDRVLDLENAIKREQLLMLVRVKNLLTPEQQALLATSRHDANQDRRQERS